MLHSSQGTAVSLIAANPCESREIAVLLFLGFLSWWGQSIHVTDVTCILRYVNGANTDGAATTLRCNYVTLRVVESETVPVVGCRSTNCMKYGHTKKVVRPAFMAVPCS